MNYIVTIKQVPDVKKIPEEAWDREKGILKRSMLTNVCNELDKQALAFALKMRGQCKGKVVGLSMGPPFAEEVLRYALAAGADEGVLLSDKKLGGADTAATAYPLAQAIRKIERDIFGGDREYVIISGVQSVDGDTAQVPPQIAQELDISHIAYTKSFSFDNGRVNVERITRNGIQRVAPMDYPFLITVTEWTEPPYIPLTRKRWAESQELRHWNAEDVSADESRIGLAGSRTTVVKVFSPSEVGMETCVFENDLEKLVEMIREAFLRKTESGGEQPNKRKYRLPEGRKSQYKGDVWVYIEQEGGEINPASFELLGKARELGDSLNEKVGAILVGNRVDELAEEVIAYGADKVYLAQHNLLEDFLPVPYTKVVSKVVERYRPQIVLFAATPLGRELAPRIAYNCESGLTADCTGLDIVDFKRGEQELIATLMQTRPALGGNIMASIITQNSKIQMSTVRPGVMKALEPDRRRRGELIQYNPTVTKNDFGARIIYTERVRNTTELRTADLIVSGGRGLQAKERYDRYIYPLAESWGKFLNKKAMVGASRLAVDMGFIDRSHQVGQTGQTVKPKLYVAVGISGAVQHITGMQGSDIILAINKDPSARIFQVADFGVVADVDELIPELIKVLNPEIVFGVK